MIIDAGWRMPSGVTIDLNLPIHSCDGKRIDVHAQHPRVTLYVDGVCRALGQRKV
ncbi:hypothetical protein SeH_A3715 [Salmonella enterica subsp. enterica serovar Hadar str. RI_05P066]|nr:hypothetical protein SeH_A3715 [Salmonella enterica subsp. enterica serovar Hadar str. RI_05P066]